LLYRAAIHPHVVRYLGIFTAEDNERYIVTEYLSKGSLAKLLQNLKSPLDVIDLLMITIQALAGLIYLEESEILHRDLALRNLLVTVIGEDEKYLIKVADFGMFRVAEGEYRVDDELVPVKWWSPEVFDEGIVSVQVGFLLIIFHSF
jgi:serine/threonine protein kinase